MKTTIPANNARLPLLTLCSVLLLGGCINAATQIPYVSSAPPEKLCTLNIAGTLIVKRFDGQDVDWAKNFTDSWASVQIAEGSHTFVVNYLRAVSDGWHRQAGITVTGDFIAGRTYRMVAAEGAEIPVSGEGLARMARMAQNTYGRRLRILIFEVAP